MGDARPIPVALRQKTKKPTQRSIPAEPLGNGFGRWPDIARCASVYAADGQARIRAHVVRSDHDQLRAPEHVPSSSLISDAIQCSSATVHVGSVSAGRHRLAGLRARIEPRCRAVGPTPRENTEPAD